MKYLAILFLTLSSLNLSTNNKLDPEDLLVSGKWYVQSLKMEKQEIHVREEQKELFYMIFEKDGVFKGSQPGGVKLATWKYKKSSEEIIIKVKGQGKEKYTIETITENNLVLKGVFQQKETFIYLYK